MCLGVLAIEGAATSIPGRLEELAPEGFLLLKWTDGWAHCIPLNALRKSKNLRTIPVQIAVVLCKNMMLPSIWDPSRSLLMSLCIVAGLIASNGCGCTVLAIDYISPVEAGASFTVVDMIVYEYEDVRPQPMSGEVTYVGLSPVVSAR